MRVLVCGGRSYRDEARVANVLYDLWRDRSITTLIHGAANGADRLAGLWGAENDIPVEEYPADWQADGRAAGPIRNARMLKEGRPDLVVAFPGGKGTNHMITLARGSGVEVIEVSCDSGSSHASEAE